MRRPAILILCSLLAAASHAASFDCAKAATPVEKMICADAQLGRLDEALARNYKSMLTANLGASRADLRKEQMQWLAERNKCKDKACLVSQYRKRVDETCDYGVVSGLHPECTMAEDVK